MYILLHFLVECMWRVMLPSTEAGGPYTITADSQQYGVIVLTDIMIGNVWICGGQSNMAFPLNGVMMILIISIINIIKNI